MRLFLFGGGSVKRLRSILPEFKSSLLWAIIFPALALVLLLAPGNFFTGFVFLGVSKCFLPVPVFVLVHLVAVYACGVSFFVLGKCRYQYVEAYNGRLLILCSVFFLQIWTFLFLFAMAPFISLIVLLLSLLSACASIFCAVKAGNLAPVTLTLFAIWLVALTVLNVKVLFI